jgi:amidase
MFKRN